MSRTPTVTGYVLVDRLHRGPAADVWRATRETDGRPVAVKIPAPGPAGSDTHAEAALLLTVRHDNLVGLVDTVTLDDGRTAVVTDLADGGSLADLVAARGRLTVGEVSAVLAPVASALWELHRRGIVHGDLSPGNVLFTDAGRPLLADLGSAGTHALTGVWGTEGFVAAEVLTGADPTPESDVFALGAVVVHALTGQGVSPLEQVDRVLRRCADVVDVPADLDDLLRAMLAGAPGDRPRASAVSRALAAVADPVGPDIGGRTEADLVTYRVRSAARQVVESARAVARPRWVGVLRWCAIAGAAALVTTAVLLGWEPAGRAAGLVADPRPAPATTVASPRRPAPTPHRTSPPAEAPRPASSPTATPTQPPAAPQAVPSGLTSDPGQVLTELLARRAAAVEARDPRLLAAVDVPGSWAAQRDAAILAALSTRGERHEGLRFTVSGARVVSSSPRAAVVEATVGLSTYRYTRDGRAATAPATPPRRERYDLAWDGRRWLVARVGPAGPTTP